MNKSMGIPKPGSLEWVPGDGTTEIDHMFKCIDHGCNMMRTTVAYMTGDLMSWSCPECGQEYEEDI